MEKQRILIVGDSFCAPTDSESAWYNLLKQYYQIDNVGQAGVGQYKIHQQLTSASISLEEYQYIIYLVTSPYRIHTEKNPFYDRFHPSHANCDLIYEDVRSRLPHEHADHIVWWFENIVDIEHSRFLHNLIINVDCKRSNIVAASFFNCDHVTGVDVLNYETIWKKNEGPINHMNPKGHQLVYERLCQKMANST